MTFSINHPDLREKIKDYKENNKQQLFKTVECDVCNGQKHFQYDEKGNVIQQFGDCTCPSEQLIKEISDFKRKSLKSKCSKMSNTPLALKDATFDTMEHLQHTDNQKLYGIAKRYTDNFDLDKVNHLLFRGGTGVGKSYYAHCIVEELKSKGYSALFLDVNAYLDQLRQSFDSRNKMPYTKDDYIRVIKEADVVVFDDIGTSKNTDWVKEQLYELINIRAGKHGKHTVFTTNLTLEEMQTERDITLSRIYGRMLENTVVVKAFGDNLRMNNIKEV